MQYCPNKIGGDYTRKTKIELSLAEAVSSLLLVAAIVLVWTYNPDESAATVVADGVLYHGPYKVVKVVDGDTVKLLIDDEITTVRLIGIDTPESVHPKPERNVPEGKLASDYTHDLLEERFVYVEYGEEKNDRYGRVLAYLYLDEHTMVNAELVENGYAQVYTIKPNDKYEEYFLYLEEAARGNNIGLWQTGVFDD